MMETQKQVGFFALGLDKASVYHADPEERRETFARIYQTIDNTPSRGVRIFGRYACRWSCEWQRFTFWICPSFSELARAMDELERVGDFKFAHTEQIMGIRIPDEHLTDKDALERGGPDVALPLGFFAIWRRTGSFYSASLEDRMASRRAVWQAFADARAAGTQMLGLYDCRWSTKWDFFTFWLVPSFETLEATMDQLEHAGDFWFASSRHVIGSLMT